jgi:hypothetical protein
MIVDVQCDDHSVHIAKIVKDSGDSCSVNFLERIHSGVFDFSDHVEMIERDSISGLLRISRIQVFMCRLTEDMNSSMIVKMKISHVVMLKAKKVMMCL